MRAIRAYYDQIGHCHTAGCPGRHDLDQELSYPAIVRAIAATGYQGYLGHEFLPKGEPVAASPSPVSSLAQSAREETSYSVASGFNWWDG